MGSSACQKVRGLDISDKASLEVGGLHDRTLGLESGKRDQAPHFHTALVYLDNDIYKIRPTHWHIH